MCVELIGEHLFESDVVRISGVDVSKDGICIDVPRLSLMDLLQSVILGGPSWDHDSCVGHNPFVQVLSLGCLHAHDLLSLLPELVVDVAFTFEK